MYPAEYRTTRPLDNASVLFPFGKATPTSPYVFLLPLKFLRRKLLLDAFQYKIHLIIGILYKRLDGFRKKSLVLDIIIGPELTLWEYSIGNYKCSAVNARVKSHLNLWRQKRTFDVCYSLCGHVPR